MVLMFAEPCRPIAPTMAPRPHVGMKFGHLATPLGVNLKKSRSMSDTVSHHVHAGKYAYGGLTIPSLKSLPLVDVNHTRVVNPDLVQRVSTFKTTASLPAVTYREFKNCGHTRMGQKPDPHRKNMPLKTLVKRFE